MYTDNEMSITVNALIAILVVGFVVLVASIALIIFLVVRNRKIYGKYKRLRLESESNLDVMSVKSETVPSAAAEDNETEVEQEK